MVSLPSRERGTAAILFVMLVPALFGVMALSIEGSRYLQTQARISDVAEVAGLALAAHNSEDIDTNEAIVKQFVQALVPDAQDSVNIDITRRDCEEIAGCGTPGVYDEKGYRFNEYEVSITTTHTSWFPKSDTNPAGFNENVSVSSQAVARKFQGEAVDVIFVSDFSGSMNYSWNGQTKISRLKEVIVDVADEVHRYSADRTEEKNTIGLVPFNFWTTKPGSTCYQTHLISQYPDSDPERTVRDWVQHDQTVAQMWDTKDGCIGYTTQYQTLSLMDDMSSFESAVNAMWANSGTASFEGLISAAQLARTGDNPRRLIVILSDGVDWDPSPWYRKWHMEQLIAAGLCDNIRNTLNAEVTSYGKEVQAKIAVIGLDYDVESDPNLANCAGEDNVYTAEDMDAVYSKLLELITEEIGRLYYRNYVVE
ncbi:TadE/TadG family type IV pilus assembly protein [Thaumasiovibrio subtropicus]|uniref:TadE/TadG family type IV pilus assembly protein n=1 Tax=Thaumasiovibrio subtropicus TaxID=1891207 RepID=UPI000B36128D|nr:pilus assembly protein [Thaumasiovibrio subtropicus]